MNFIENQSITLLNDILYDFIMLLAVLLLIYIESVFLILFYSYLNLNTYTHFIILYNDIFVKVNLCLDIIFVNNVL